MGRPRRDRRGGGRHERRLPEVPEVRLASQAIGHDDVADGVVSEDIIGGVKIGGAPEGGQPMVGKFKLESGGRDRINFLSFRIEGRRTSGSRCRCLSS